MSKDHHRPRPSLMNVSQSDALKGLIGVPALYISAATHVAPFLSKEGGFAQRFLLPFWSKIFSILRLGQPAKGKVPIALLVAGATVTLILSASGSIYGNAASNKDGYSNREPRLQKRQLIGLHGRMASAHDNLLEFFSAFAAAAILAAQYDDTKGALNNQIALAATLK